MTTRKRNAKGHFVAGEGSSLRTQAHLDGYKLGIANARSLAMGVEPENYLGYSEFVTDHRSTKDKPVILSSDIALAHKVLAEHHRMSSIAVEKELAARKTAVKAKAAAKPRKPRLSKKAKELAAAEAGFSLF